MMPSVSLFLRWHEGVARVAARLTGIGGDERAVEPKDRHVWVDEDHFLLAVALVEELEKGCEQRVAKIITLVVG